MQLKLQLRMGLVVFAQVSVHDSVCVYVCEVGSTCIYMYHNLGLKS